MQFIGQYNIDVDLCDKLIELHKIADQRGLIIRGRFNDDDGELVIDVKRKDSYDLGITALPTELQEEYGIPEYLQALKTCTDKYFELHPILNNLGALRISETPVIQYFKPGGGLKFEHFERTDFPSSTRVLTWMTFLNDVTDEGGMTFTYQDVTITPEKGKTLVWPSDFTHTHLGQVSKTQEKYIITGWLNFFELK